MFILGCSFLALRFLRSMTVVDGGQHFLGRGKLCDPWEDHLEAVEVSALGRVGDGVGHDCQLVAAFVRGPRRGFDADAGGDAGEDDPGDLSPPELEVEFSAVEGIPASLGDPDVAVAEVELSMELAPVGWRGGLNPVCSRPGCDHVPAVRRKCHLSRYNQLLV